MAEIGHMALILAGLTALLQALLPLWGAYRHKAALMRFADRAAIIQFGLIALSFLMLSYGFIQSDFSIKLVASHSHTAKPLIYKISGVWGNHEGSMLLWVLMLSLFGALIAVRGGHLPLSLRARALGVQGLLGVGFIAFLLLTSNPFERLIPTPANGQGLNPLLQDPGLALHPPFLYLGYVGFSVAFSFSIAALLEGQVDALWARWVRPWVLLAWSFLTLGITLGSLWAYYELGWGGWWMWDPVENVSFLPWLTGTALLHSILVLGTRHIMASWTILLGITTFSLSMIGTFVVRSGVLISVHAFAVDPSRGIFILGLLALATGSALTLYALRAHRLRFRSDFIPFSKDGGLVLNNILLITATLTVFLGTFYPLMMDAISQEKISVGAPYFDLTFAPIMCVLIAIMTFAPLLKWRQGHIQNVKKFIPAAVSLFIITALLVGFYGSSILGGLSLALSAVLALGTVWAVGRKCGWQLARIKYQPAATYGFLLGHMGLAIFMAGVTFMSVWAKENMGTLEPGQTLNVSHYDFTLQSISEIKGDNYIAARADFTVTKAGRVQTHLKSSRRFYPVRDMMTTEAGMKIGVFHSYFVALSEPSDDQKSWVVRAYYHPGVSWIWFGAVLIALAGFVSLGDRRLSFHKDQPSS